MKAFLLGAKINKTCAWKFPLILHFPYFRPFTHDFLQSCFILSGFLNLKLMYYPLFLTRFSAVTMMYSILKDQLFIKYSKIPICHQVFLQGPEKVDLTRIFRPDVRISGADYLLFRYFNIWKISYKRKGCERNIPIFGHWTSKGHQGLC